MLAQVTELGSNNLKIATKMYNIFQEHDWLDVHAWNPQTDHVHCFLHNLALVVKAGLSESGQPQSKYEAVSEIECIHNWQNTSWCSYRRRWEGDKDDGLPVQPRKTPLIVIGSINRDDEANLADFKNVHKRQGSHNSIEPSKVGGEAYFSTPTFPIGGSEPDF